MPEQTSNDANIGKRLERIEAQVECVLHLSSLKQNDELKFSSMENVGDIDLSELLGVVWRGKWIIAAVTCLFAIAFAVFSLSLPNTYRSEALLAPADENSGGGLAGLAGQFGGLASLAGVNLGGGADKTALALEVLRSREFISNFIRKYELMVPLMAAEGWDSQRDELLIDGSVYSVIDKRWLRKPKGSRAAEPTSQEAYEEFIARLSVSQDKTSGFITLGFEYYSPQLAKNWVDNLVVELNLEVKARDVAEAEKSIRYLSGQLGRTAIADMRTIFYELIEEQSKTVMFAEVRDEYVFKTIDKAVVPELKSKPRRVLIVLLGVFLGVACGGSIVLFRGK